MAAYRSPSGTSPTPLTSPRSGWRDQRVSLPTAPDLAPGWVQRSPPDAPALEVTSLGTTTPDFSPSDAPRGDHGDRPHWSFFWVAAFLVCGPVFIEAPLVRAYPTIAVAATGLWAAIAWGLSRRDRTRPWGDLLFGFCWSWLAGAIYWGWFRQEPALHLPIEAIGLPIALGSLALGKGRIGAGFYLGSLLGTAITDAYCYAVDLLPDWRAAMAADPSAIAPILHGAIAKMNATPGILWAILLASSLAAIGLMALGDRSPMHRAFAGAVLNTLLVDGLFWLAAAIA